MDINITLRNGQTRRIRVDDELHELPESCREPQTEDKEDMTAA